MNIPDVYDNSRKFLFSNWTDEDFTGQWNGVQTLIKAGETKEFDMSTAYHFTKHLVDRELEKGGKSNLLGVQEERGPLESKTVAELSAGQDSPALATLKEKIRVEVVQAAEKKGKKTKKVAKEESPSKIKEFEDIS